MRSNRPTGPAHFTEYEFLVNTFPFYQLNTAVMRRAAELWAATRLAGKPTADDRVLDADVILATQAQIERDAGRQVTVATENVKHLGRFVDARPWPQIT